MTRILPHQTLIQSIANLAEGNPGALSVLTRVYKEGPDIDPDSIAGGLANLLLIDQYGVYGSGLWILYKDVCGEDLTKFIGLIRAVQLGFITEAEYQGAARDAVAPPLDATAILAKVQDRLPNFGGILQPPTRAAEHAHGH